MNISMEKFNLEKHAPHLVATLIYAADREFNEIVYGSKWVPIPLREAN